MRAVRYLVVGVFSCALSGGSAFASSSSNTAAAPIATATTVSQSSTQNIVRTISSSVSDGLARAFSSGNLFRHSPANNKRVGLGQGETGVSTGNSPAGFGVWGSADYTYLRIVPDGDRAQRRLTDIYSGVAGLDYAINDKAVTGVAVGYGHAETDGRTARAFKLDQTSDSFTVAPYLGLSPMENMTVDVVVGYTYASIDTTDYSFNTVAKGSNNSNTVFSAVNLGYVMPVTNDVAIKGFTGFSFQHGSTDSYTDSRNNEIRGDSEDHWVARLGAKALWAVTDSTEAYVSAAYERDRQTPALSENSARMTLGTSSKLLDGLDLVAEGMANFGRETQQEYGAAVNLRLLF